MNDIDFDLGTPEEVAAKCEEIYAMYDWRGDRVSTASTNKKKYHIGRIYESNQIKGFLLDFDYKENKASLRLFNGLKIKVKLDTLEAYIDGFNNKTGIGTMKKENRNSVELDTLEAYTDGVDDRNSIGTMKKENKNSLLGDILLVYKVLFSAVFTVITAILPAIASSKLDNDDWLWLLLVSVPVGGALSMRFWRNVTKS